MEIFGQLSLRAPRESFWAAEAQLNPLTAFFPRGQSPAVFVYIWHDKDGNGTVINYVYKDPNFIVADMDMDVDVDVDVDVCNVM